jgi:hypothetical protein
MTANLIVGITLAAFWVLVILGGLGVHGLGTDSREIEEGERTVLRRWRSLLTP